MILLTEEEIEAIYVTNLGGNIDDLNIAKAQLKKVAGQMEDTYDKAPIGKKLATMERFMLDLLKEVE